ncbi:protein abnormal spindle isoform X1 [Diorhabda carinulata]|uniref:protein abnormal spindle isoform X1 n=2 Tax=Diorhabda carinulata TaxID=1163345 RepID=UPI0025A147CF|nr:protein abnormal spindle isoform X1 [Diorhabda carinulata]
MFFQISPVRREPKPKCVIKEKTPEKIEILSLGPFAAVPKLFFDEIKIGDTASCKLILRNPTKHDITILLTKRIPEELNVIYNWEKNRIKCNSEVLFEIIWTPRSIEASYHKLTFENPEGTIHRDVPVVFKTVSTLKKAKIKKNTKPPLNSVKSPSKKYYNTKPPFISPKRYFVSPKKNVQFKKSPSPKKNSHSLKTNKSYSNVIDLNKFSLREKENIPTEQFVASKNVSFKLDYLDTIERRETYVLKREDSDVFDDSLEITNSATIISSPDKKMRPPLTSYNGSPLSPDVSLGTYFKQKSEIPVTPSYGLEYKLMHLETFCFTPTLSLKNEPINNTKESVGLLNVPLKSFTHSRLSTETYVKDNTSFETYVKGNLSGETYTKDLSLDHVEHLSSDALSPNYQEKMVSKYSTYTQHVSNADQSKIDYDNGQIHNTIKSTFEFTRPQNTANFENKTKNMFNFTKHTNFLNSTPVIEKNTDRSMRCTSKISPIEDKSVRIEQTRNIRIKSDLDLSANFSKPGGGLTGPRDWSKRGCAPFRIAKTSTGLNLKRNISELIDEETQVVSKIAKRDMNTIIIQNPFLLASTDTFDPFMTSQLYVDAKWIDEQEVYFQKWLNSLLTPPQELYSEDRVIDVAKVWQECKKREVEAAPTKEIVSIKYHVNAKLNSLRKSAQALFRSREMSGVLSKVLLAVDNGKLNIRQDRHVHLNLAIKSQIMSLLLSYNSLWLRIGLETIYNEIINLRSNSDIVGLSTFLINRLFKDPYLLKKYKSIHSPKYVIDFNKFFLKKFLTLVYFLDVAKNNKLIPHNPCLFCKNGEIKESRDMLLTLARELLSQVGDITKTLKFFGYIVTHVQTFIHEFDYAVKNLGVDLRDGVRLTKVMEIILLKDDLTNNLRVPSISRLQKVHNMKLVFDSLEKAGFKIMYDITPKDIVDGHREKTLSFLWQIIYKFEAPLMVKCATTIQSWYRSLPVMLKRRKLQKLYKEKQNAASKIQNWYKRQKLATKLNYFAYELKHYLYIVKIEKAAKKIQSFYRMYKQRRAYKQQIKSIKGIQTYSKGWLIRNFYIHRIQSAVIIQSYFRMFVERKKYLKIQKSVRIIQSWYNSKKQLRKYQKLRSATIFIQRKLRAHLLGIKQQNEYQKLKQTTKFIQRRYRANALCRIERTKYQTLKLATIFIQTHYRSLKLMKLHRQKYIELKKAVLIVEERYLALKAMRLEQQKFIKIKTATLVIQEKFRATLLTRIDRFKYLTMKRAIIILQTNWRAYKLSKIEQERYKVLRKTTLLVQRRWRANIACKNSKSYYLKLKATTLFVQQKWRANIKCRIQREEYQLLRKNVIFIQRKIRAKIEFRKVKKYYEELRTKTIFIQKMWRNKLLARRDRKVYMDLKLSTIFVQKRWRWLKLGEKQHEDYVKLRKATIFIQQKLRAKIEYEKVKKYYEKLKEKTIFIQKLWRNKLLARRDRKLYVDLKISTIYIQKRWRWLKLGEKQHEDYVKLRKATIFIQQKWKAKIEYEKVKKHYEELKERTIFIQKMWKNKLLARKDRKLFVDLKLSTIFVQKRWRWLKLGEKQHEDYVKLRKATIFLQQKWKAHIEYKKVRKHYEKLKEKTIFIQNLWRNKLLARRDRKLYVDLKISTIYIQKRWRWLKLGEKQHEDYVKLRKATIFIQQKWKAKIEYEKVKKHYEELRAQTIFVQKMWKNKLLARKDRKLYVDLKLSTIYIQKRWRWLKLGKREREDYLNLRKATIFIQRRWKANKQMKIAVEQYISLKRSATTIQRSLRATLEMRKQKQIYAVTKYSIIIIQRWYRNCLLTRKEMREYLLKKKAILEIQKYIKGYLIRKKYAEYFTPEARERRRIEKLENEAAIKIQATWRGYKTRCLGIPGMKSIRERCIKANATAAPEGTIQFRCNAALQTIAHKNSTLFQINNALEDIDYATRRCKSICITLGKLLPEQLYILLSSTSRSLPEMNACIYSVNILINFFKLEETKESSFSPHYLEKLVTLMMHWCDKESQLFPSLCTLFWLFAHTPQWRRLIINIPNIDKKFEKIGELVSRKDSMVKKQGAKGSALFASFKNLPMPSLVADWGLDYKNNPFVFTNSVHAFNSLMSILFK